MTKLAIRGLFLSLLALYSFMSYNAVADSRAKTINNKKPLALIYADNDGTEITDFLVPFYILKESEGFEVITVSKEPGKTQVMGDGVYIHTDTDIESYLLSDGRLPDLFVVPAVRRSSNKSLSALINKFLDNGTHMMSVCAGSYALAYSGILNNHKAIGHFANHDDRSEKFPEVHWQKNTRYITSSNGKITTTSGISASAPAMLKIVEEYIGKEKAQEIASRLGMSSYESTHNSEDYKISKYDFDKNKHHYHIVADDGISEYGLAFGLDLLAYVSHKRKNVVRGNTKSAEYAITKHGLKLLIDSKQELAEKDFNVRFSSIESDLNFYPDNTVIKNGLMHLFKNYGQSVMDNSITEMELPLQLSSSIPKLISSNEN